MSPNNTGIFIVEFHRLPKVLNFKGMRTNLAMIAAKKTKWSTWLLVAFMMAYQTVDLFAAKQLSGKDIYQKQCVKCHGKVGEGVKGKYDEPLVGDWSPEKLSRVIAKTMPDDKPGSCVGPDADAVAKYVYETFYSRQARARLNPARVELVHLTNPQYLNTVADLIRRVTNADSRPLGEQRGLRATYFKSRGMGDKAFDRIDREVNFDFGTETPDKEKMPKTEEFAIRWDGSLIAEETGDYEFILKTPNGARLWINSHNREEATIDAWVASSQTEHRCTVKLIGGRVYPLSLSVFKFKDKTASVNLQWKAPHGALQTIPARNLYPESVPPTLVLNTPFPADDRSIGYERGVAMSKAWDEATTQAAMETAAFVAKNIDRYTRTKATDKDRKTKVEAFCADFVEGAFRQPLTEEMKRLYVTQHFHGSEDIEKSVKRVVILALKSPYFLYLGLDNDTPNAYTTATRLSYALWDSMPDRPMMQLTAQGKLNSKEDVAQQAQRMLVDSRAKAKVQGFMLQWLQLGHIEDVSKDDKIYPGFTPEIIADLRTSLYLFLDDVVWKGNSDYRQFLLSDSFFANERLAKFYGLDAAANNDFVKVKLDTKQRAGVVTHPYILAAFSYQKLPSPIHRGVFLTRSVIGRALKPPAAAVAFKDADFDPKMSMREKVSALTKGETCQTCHAVINPLGFTLENFDAVGRYRTMDNGRTIDAVSDYMTDEGDIITFKSARQLAEFAANSDHAKNRFVEQLFHHLIKQPIMAYGPDMMGTLSQTFAASGCNVQKLLVEIATVSALHQPDKILTAKKK